MVSNCKASAICAYFLSNAISIVFQETTSETGHVADLKEIQQSINSFARPSSLEPKLLPTHSSIPRQTQRIPLPKLIIFSARIVKMSYPTTPAYLSQGNGA
jgi:hypothetical protein